MRFSSFRNHLAAIAVAIAGLAGVDGATVELFPAADTAMFELRPENNLGSNDTLVVGTTAKGEKRRALLKFDVASLAAEGAMAIASVELRITVTRAPLGGGAASDVRLHRLLRDWGEGTKTGRNGAPATHGATWDHRFFPDQRWSEPGAVAPVDYVEAPSATVRIDGPADYVFTSTPAMVDDLTVWINEPELNFGWILISEAEDTKATARRVASREAANAPRLKVEFVESAGLSPAILGVPRLLPGGRIEIAVTGEFGVIYRIEVSEDLENWAEFKTFTLPEPFQPEAVFTDVLNETSRRRFYRMVLVGANR